jgi:predicted DsbA family dithiol-disulfide isomerase
MGLMETTEAPPGHTPEGGVLVGSEGARSRLVVFEDPQCPYCREFEAASGDLLRREIASGAVAVEYRIRSFLGEESVRAANALAAAAGPGKFDELRRELFAEQPPEHSGGFSADVLVELGRRVGLTGSEYVAAVRARRYERWVREIDEAFEEQDSRGTPFALLDDRPVGSDTLYDPDRLGSLIRA